MGKRVQGTLKKLATQLISDMTKEIVAKGSDFPGMTLILFILLTLRI